MPPFMPLQILLLVVVLTAAAFGADAPVHHLHPVAGSQGATVALSVSGKLDPWPQQAWVDAPGIVFTAAKTAGKFDVAIASDAAPGPHLVRFFSEKGVTAPRFFIVAREPQIADTEPNDEFKSPQKIPSLPAAICGRLDKGGDVDCFAITLRRGEQLMARVEAYVLASTFDAMLRVVDADGTLLAFHHDGRTLDPLLLWSAPRDGEFVVQLMGFVYPATADVRLTGGEGCVYRLHLEKDGKIGKEAMTGVIAQALEEGRHPFTAEKGRGYELQVTAARDGSPLDAWLKIENQQGKELARNDDAEGSRDPKLTWIAPADGEFTAVIGDVTHRGGADYRYRLSIAQAAPGLAATTPAHSLNVAPGKTGEMKVKVTRTNGWKAKLQLAAKNLPEGVSAPDVEVPAKDGEVTLKFTANADAMPASQPFQMILRETETAAEHPVRYMMTTTGENNGVPQGYTELVIDSTEQLWLTVLQK